MGKQQFSVSQGDQLSSAVCVLVSWSPKGGSAFGLLASFMAQSRPQTSSEVLSDHTQFMYSCFGIVTLPCTQHVRIRLVMLKLLSRCSEVLWQLLQSGSTEMFTNVSALSGNTFSLVNMRTPQTRFCIPGHLKMKSSGCSAILVDLFLGTLWVIPCGN